MSDKPILDQVAHVSGAVLSLLPAALWPNPLTFGFAGMCMGFLKELTEVGSTVTLDSLEEAVDDRGSQLDILFWALGGVFVGIFAI